MNLRNLDSTLVFFFLVLIFVLFWFPCFLVTHLSTSSSWQTEVQDKSLPAWSRHLLCTVESLDLAMSDGHPSPLPQWARWDSQVGRGEGLCSSVSPPEVRVGESSVLWALAGPPLCGLAQLWPPSWVSLVVCAGAPQPEPLDRPCQLFPLSLQLTEWLPLVPQILETYQGFLCVQSSLS